MKYFCFRLEAWLIVLCVGMTTTSESHPCPCIPRNLCPRVFGASPVDEKVTGPMKPCSNPGTVHCCGTSVSLQEQQPIHIAVADNLKKEEQLMEFVNNAIERMNNKYSVENVQRADKSIGIAKKNNFGCNKKQCSDISEEKSRHLNKTNTSTLAEIGQNEFFNSSDTIFSHSKSSEVLSGNGTVEKVYIVYAENPNLNNAYLGKESNAQIVLPTTEPKQESLSARESTTEENENEPQESSIDPIQVHTSVEENPDQSLTQTKSKLSRFQMKNQLHDRKSNRLQKLFPKRRPPPQVLSKSPQDGDGNQQSGDDVEIAESNLDEVRDIETIGVAEDYPDDEDVYDEIISTDEEYQSQGSLPPLPKNLQNKTEQSDSRRLPLAPRRLTSQQMRPEEIKLTTKNALDLFKSRTKSRNDPMVRKPIEEPMKTKQYEPVGTQVVMQMDEINVKVINDLMKTNFTGRSSLRSNAAFKSSRAPLKTTNNRLVSSLNRNNQEQKNTESSSQPRIATSQIIQQLKPQTQNTSPTNQNHEQTTNQGTGLSEENKVHRFQLKRRPILRNQNTKPPSTLASPISMTQEPAFDTSRGTSISQVQARRQPFFRMRTRPQVTQTTADNPSVPQSSQSFEELTTPKPSAPLYIRKRLPSRERPQQRVENTNNSKNKKNEEPKVATEPETTSDGEYVSSTLKTGQDLDGSGSNYDYQKTHSNGKFIAPSELETGFRPMPPMMESRELQVVGPLPGGFLDPATGFSEGDQIGLELPNPNFLTQFQNEESFNQNTRQPTLLPPVFSVSHPQTQFKNEGSFNHNTKPPSFTTPVFPVPQPQVTSRAQFLPNVPATEAQQFFDHEEETPQFEEQEGGDLVQIQNQFGTLKNQYDTLLNRYAQTLNTYIGQYKKLINSAPPNIH